MAWTPISGTMTQYSTSANILAANYYIKFYQSGTTTAFNMATDSTGGTTLDKCQLDSSGYPTTDGTTRFIPYVDQTYKIVLYQNATDADNNTTGNAEWVIDAVMQPAVSGDIPTNPATLASNVTYTPGGSGAVNTDVQTKLRQGLHADDFGIDSTGATDQSALFSSIISVANTLKLPIYFSGTIRIDSSITLKSNTQIIGADAWGNDANGSNIATFDWRGTGDLFSTGGSPKNNIYFNNFAVDVTNNANIGHDCMSFSDGLRWAKLENISLQGITSNTRHGIYLTCSVSSYHVDLENITSWGTGFATGAWIRVEGGGSVGQRYNDVSIMGGDVYNFTEGVRVMNSYRTTIHDTYFAQNSSPGTVYGIRYDGNLNREHGIFGVKFEPDVDIHVQIDCDDVTDCANIVDIYSKNVFRSLIQDSVVGDSFRYTLFGKTCENVTAFVAIGGVQFTDNNNGSGATPNATADDIHVNNNTHAGITVSTPASNLQSWYAFGSPTNGQYGGVRGRADTEAVFIRGARTDLIELDGSKNVTLGETVALVTTATDGFVYIPTCSGNPSGTPTSKTGKVPMVYNTSNNTLHIYNGSWRSVALT